MHRELTSIERPFHKESNLGLYLFTGLLLVLLGLDIWPYVTAWLTGESFPATPPRIALGAWSVRYAILAGLFGLFRLTYSTLTNLMAGRLGADLAMLVAVIAAFAIQEPLVAAEVLLIGLIGESLEAYTFGRTQKALRGLIQTFPPMCLVQRQGQTVKISIDEVQPGERVVILPGKRLPVDGVVVEGRSSIDQSHLTGESVPVDVDVGSHVFAGTVNQFGSLIVETRQVSTQTVLGRMIELTTKALQQKTHVERLADRMARYFLPAVLGLALLTFLMHWMLQRGNPNAMRAAIYPALAVLVVACPCALILATPATLMAAVARLAKTGVLLKSTASLEQLAQINACIFDKTGTLTEGKLQLGDVHPLAPEWSVDSLLQWTASLEQRSEHPIARLLQSVAKDKTLTLHPTADFQALPGAGVRAQIDGRETVAASITYMQQIGLDLTPQLISLLQEYDRTGQTVLLLAVDGKLVGTIGVWDTIRPEAAATIESLRQLGIHDMALVTGDRQAAAQRVAEALSLPQVMAECLPEKKAEWVERWQKENKRVAVIGDGVNDTLALAKADVGFALSGVGSDLTAEAGDIILMGEPLQPLPLLFRLSRQVVAIIRQNIIYFAFGVNVFGVLLTAWVLPFWSEARREQSPLWAAVYHQLGSLAVLLNAMRLLWFEREVSSSSWLGQVRQRIMALDQWLERFRWHELIHRLEEHWRFVLACLVFVSVMLYLASGIWLIEADQVGVVQRCGKVLDEQLTPGIHWRWPWPWEQVIRIEPGQLRSVEVGFRSQRKGMNLPVTLTWSSSHGGQLLNERDESLMLTGDGNLIEMQWIIHYTIFDPKRYLFAAVDPDLILRSLAESVLRELLAKERFQNVLSGQRASFQQTVLQNLQRRLTAEAYQRLGVQIYDIAFQDVHPPLEVVDAYYNVTRAMSERSRRVTEEKARVDALIAQETINRIRNLAHWQAKADAVRKLAEAERDALIALQLALHWPGMLLPVLPTQNSGAGMPWAWAFWVACSQTTNAAEATSMWAFRQSIEVLEQYMPGRFKIIRDPKVKGQIQLLPDAFRWRPAPSSYRERPGPESEQP